MDMSSPSETLLSCLVKEPALEGEEGFKLARLGSAASCCCAALERASLDVGTRTDGGAAGSGASSGTGDSSAVWLPVACEEELGDWEFSAGEAELLSVSESDSSEVEPSAALPSLNGLPNRLRRLVLRPVCSADNVSPSFCVSGEPGSPPDPEPVPPRPPCPWRLWPPRPESLWTAAVELAAVSPGLPRNDPCPLAVDIRAAEKLCVARTPRRCDARSFFSAAKCSDDACTPAG